MHLNYHFLRFLCPQLDRLFRGQRILDCFSQNKDELVIETAGAAGTRFIRAHFLPPSIYYAFPAVFSRAKRNSINLFPELIGDQLLHCFVLENDRSFRFELASGAQLLFKLHSTRSNVLYYPAGQELPSRLFRNELKEDRALAWRSLSKELDQSYESFQVLAGNASQFAPTLGKLPREWLKNKGYPNAPLEKKWELMQEILDYLDSPVFSLVQTGEDEIALSLLPHLQTNKQFSDPLEAINELFHQGMVIGRLEQEKKQLLKYHGDRQKRTINYLSKTKTKLDELLQGPPPSQIADVVMANLHRFKDGVRELDLDNFYTQQPLTVHLKQGQSPQAYAAHLYRKNKNRKIEIEQLQQSIQSKESLLEEVQTTIEAIVSIDDFKGLKEFKKQHTSPGGKKSMEDSLPFRQFSIEGTTVWVGKSAQGNDELLRRYAHKNDLWLHARKVAGSHVLIRNATAHPIPIGVVERAASLAAYYSKLKTEKLAPVIYTEAKYVRKVKGSPPGMVQVDREKTILVQPEGPDESIAT